jgi:hypothetical protein
MVLGTTIYGGLYPNKATGASLYGMAFLYADLTRNGDRFIRNRFEIYMDNIKTGQEEPLDFVFYVPKGMESLNGSRLPNVEATDDPDLIWTAHFAGEKEIWP